jgi:hypothetical protein
LLNGAFGVAILVLISQYIMYHCSTWPLFYVRRNSDSFPVRKLPVAEGLRFGQLTHYDCVSGTCCVLQATGNSVNLISKRCVTLLNSTDVIKWEVVLYLYSRAGNEWLQLYRHYV